VNIKLKERKTRFKIFIAFIFLIVNIIMFWEIVNIRMFSDQKKCYNNTSSFDRIFLCTLYNNEAELCG
jgi:hypothetical protein